MTEYFISLLVEGLLDEVILRQIFAHYPQINIQACYGKQGKHFLQKRINNYNLAAIHTPFICLVDLDEDDCPIALINTWLPEGRNTNFTLRVAVKEVEAWLLADRENFAAYMGISSGKIPPYPDDIPDPKQLIVNLARQSRIKRIRQNIVPADESTSMIGKAYISELTAFTLQKWDIDKADSNSPSLSRALNAFNNLPIYED
jgi:hypothetical protein